MRRPLIKSCQSKFPLMSLIGANALPLLANIKAREDGNLTLPAFHAASESSLSKKKKSILDNSCCVLISETKSSKQRV